MSLLNRTFTFLLPISVAMSVGFSILAMRAQNIPFYLAGTTSDWLAKPDSAQRSSVLVVGDSVVASLEPAMNSLAAELDLSLRIISISGCPLLPGLIVGEDGAIYEPSRKCSERVEEDFWHKITGLKFDAVLWLNAWDAEDRLVGQKILKQGQDENEIEVLLTQVARRLSRASDKIFIAPVPPRAIRSSAAPDGPSEYAKERVWAYSSTLRDFVSRDNQFGLRYIDLPQLVCDGQRDCEDTSNDGVRFRPIDGIHFDGRGSQIAAAWLLQILYRDLLSN